MKIHQFLPLAALVIAAFCAFAYETDAPMGPTVVIGTFGAFLAALQLENHKWADFFGELIAGLKDALKH